ncbi:response regulator [Tumidithrix elongata RA019]|uniref:histidine kinase n=1 Tax=Tumidithrix elongata BACA0141 TaxID=2716417 RepID=A0AAW9Q1N8_9CYAN|nr:response regulator [Tumidithrix elongata RA019]
MNNAEVEARQMLLKEAQEHLFEIEDYLVGLDPKSLDFKEKIDSMLRSAHSLKGGASMMQLDSLSSAAHRIEDALKLLENIKSEITQEIHGLFLQGIEQLLQIVALNRQGESVDRAWMAEHIDLVFDQLFQKLHRDSEEKTTEMVEEVVDLAALIFETEVESHLENLEALLDSSSTLYRLDEELLTVSTDLAAIGKMLDLENFVQLCESISLYICAGKYSITRLSQVALSVWRRSQALVLSGNSESIPSSIETELANLGINHQPQIEREIEEGSEINLTAWLEPTDTQTSIEATVSMTSPLSSLREMEAEDEEETMILLASPVEFISEEDMNQVELWVEEENSPFNLAQMTDSESLFNGTTQTDLNTDLNSDRASLLDQDIPEPFFEDRTVLIDYMQASSNGVEPIEIVSTQTEIFDDEQTESDLLNAVETNSDQDCEIFYARGEIFPSTEMLSETPFIEDRLSESLIEENISAPFLAIETVKTEEDPSDRNVVIHEKDIASDDLIDVGQIAHYQEMFLDNEVEISEIFTHVVSTDAKAQPEITSETPFTTIPLIKPEASHGDIVNPTQPALSDAAPMLGNNTEPSETSNLLDSELIEMDDAFWQGLDRMLGSSDHLSDSGNSLMDWVSDASLPLSEPVIESANIASNPQSFLEDNLSSSEIYQAKHDGEPVQMLPDRTIEGLEVAPENNIAIAPTVEVGFERSEVVNLERDDDFENITDLISYEGASHQKALRVSLPLSHLDNLSRLAEGLVISKSNLDMQLDRLKELSRQLQRHIRNLDDSQDDFYTTYTQTFNHFDFKTQENLQNESSNESSDKWSDQSNGNRAFATIKQLDRQTTLTPDRSNHLLSLAQSVTEAISQLEEVTQGINLTLLEAEQESASVGHEFSQLVTSINYAKVMPFSDLVSRFPKILRNLSLQYGKQVELKIKGGDTLIERAIADALVDPLQHLLRNAFDHGIEDAPTRKARGKQEHGNIEMAAVQTAGRVLITVRDDGGGIDLEKIRVKVQQTAFEEGLDSSSLTQVSDAKLISFIFEPGFSTANKVSPLSGRGIGMDVVRTNLHQIGADISVASKSGEGTKFTIGLPRKSPIVKIVLVEVDQMFLAIPCNEVQAIIPFTSDEILSKEEESSVFVWQDREVPIVRLSDRLKLNCHLNAKQQNHKPANATPSMLILQHERELMAIPVDACWGEQDARLHEIEGDISLPDAFSGCLVLGNGQPVVLLSPAEISLQWLRANPLGGASMVYSPQAKSPKRTAKSSIGSSSDSDDVVLIVDDSSNTRHSLVQALEKAGFKTEQAKDGDDALLKIRSGIRVNAIVSDIEMPHMDGYGLLSKLKANEALSHLPVIFLTSNSDETQQQHALSLGAAACICAPYQENDLVQAVKQQLGMKS